VTVLVTGGSGLVGSHVIVALRERGVPVRALVRARSGARATFERLGAVAVPGDVTDAAAWTAAVAMGGGGLTGIVHAAALVTQRASFAEYERVNVGGTRLAVGAARAAGVPLVHISSVAVYGGTAAYRPVAERRDEDHPFGALAPWDRYARAKRDAEAVVRAAAERDGLACVALRPNVIFGERDRVFTPRVLAAVRLGWAPALGAGTNHLSCVYAGNVASAAVAALDAARPGFRAYHVTRDRPPALTEREFIAAFADALGRRVRRLRVPAALLRGALALRRGPRLARAAVSFLTGENPYAADRITAELGWSPPFDTRAAIRRSVQAA
jgi:nucleoside-diphosphate-sugar epimerase